MPDKERKKPRYSRAIQLTGIGFQMGVTIFLGAYLGKYLDQVYPNPKKWYTIGCTLFAVSISFYAVLKQVNRMNKRDDEVNS